MSIPAWARISSTAMGSRNCFQQVVAQLPPAWGEGTTQTSSQPYFPAASRSNDDSPVEVLTALCRQPDPFSASTGAMPA